MVDVCLDLVRYLRDSTDTKFDWIKTMSADGVANATAFINDLPDTPDSAMSAIRYSGEPPDETMSNAFQKRNPRVQFMVRDRRSEVALQRAEDIMKFLSQIKDQTINGTRYARVSPVGEPEEVGPDSSARERASLNMKVSYYDTMG